MRFTCSISLGELFSLLNSKVKKLTEPYRIPKIQQAKILVIGQRFGYLFSFGLVWQYSTNQKEYNSVRFKVIATYLQQ